MFVRRRRYMYPRCGKEYSASYLVAPVNETRWPNLGRLCGQTIAFAILFRRGILAINPFETRAASLLLHNEPAPNAFVQGTSDEIITVDKCWRSNRP
jgi:hypothetical protein